MRRNAVVITAALACAVALTPARAPDPGSESQREAGMAIYREKCSQCHGENGDGKGVGAEFFKPLPRDFTSGAFKIRTTGSGELPTDADIKAVIRRGMPHTGMPAWPKFSDGELSALAYFIKTFNPEFADSANLTDPLDFPRVPAFSRESARRGQAVYEENKCMDCHGRKGRGDGESAPTLEDDWGNSIRPADLTKRWTFRGGPSREDIYRTFMTGLNGTPMPSYASSIEKEADRWALVDFVHSLSPGDKAPYASVVEARYIRAEVDLKKGRELFKDAKAALFPVVGQVIGGKRNFFPAADAVEVRAVYDSSRIAILVSWNDMSADRRGSNRPQDKADGAIGEGISDAVAVQLPWNPLIGAAKPYLLFGDARNPAEIWFQDLSGGDGERFIGKGEGDLSPDGSFRTISGHEDGEWWFAFARERKDGKRLALEPGAFVPIAFSVWDGFGGETGGARGVTSWYSLYLEPGDAGAPWLLAGKAALGVLFLELLAIWIIRRRLRAARK